MYTLRWAIDQVNASGTGDNVIDFAIDPVNTWQTITVGGGFTIRQPVIINGLSQGGPSAPCVEINGNGSSGPGFEVDAPQVTLEGLAIDRFQGDGIVLNNPAGQPGDTVVACHVGTGLVGTETGIGNTGNGITVLGANNGISRDPVSGIGALHSLLSGNGQNGVDIRGASATGNTLLLNDIGLDANGQSLPNGLSGVLIEAGASGNQIGLPYAGYGNWISGNSGDGVRIDGSPNNNVASNLIGLSTDGSTAVPNSGNGVVITNGASGNDIAGDTISGNSGDGVRIDGSTSNSVASSVIGLGMDGDTPVANGGNGVLITGGGSQNNLTGDCISGNIGDGVLIDGGDDNTLGGCFVGLSLVGPLPRPNAQNGWELRGASARNTSVPSDVYSGNTLNGILLSGPGVVGTKIYGSTIGTNRAGDTKVANAKNGILIQGAVGTTIGGAAADQPNLISGNTAAGVSVQGPDTQVISNFIGLNRDGTAPLANDTGVEVKGATATNTLIQSNKISGNTNLGVYVSSGAAGTKIYNCYIGTDSKGNAKVANDYGVFVGTATDTEVGADPLGGNYGNIISGNTSSGVYLQRATRTKVVRNWIGLAANGAALKNGEYGVRVLGGTDNTIGATTTNGFNVISGNGYFGVSISGAIYKTSNTLVINNRIGLGTDGTTAVANGYGGVEVDAATGTTIGGSSSFRRNVISGNDGKGSPGILIKNVTGTVVLGNYIGTTADGKAKAGNGGDGIYVSNADQTVIGGPGDDDGNVIADNGGFGVRLDSNNCTVTGNIIGFLADRMTKAKNASGWLQDNGMGNKTGGNTVNVA